VIAVEEEEGHAIEEDGLSAWNSKCTLLWQATFFPIRITRVLISNSSSLSAFSTSANNLEELCEMPVVPKSTVVVATYNDNKRK
jgi:hypothetical protein